MSMQNTLVHIAFPNHSADDAWKALSGTPAEGYFAQNAQGCFALVHKNMRVLHNLGHKKIIAGDFETTDHSGFRNTDFKGLKRLEINDTGLQKPHVSIDSITPHGRLIGWGGTVGDAPVHIALSLDGEPVETLEPHFFREDLLRANIGLGCAGFSTRLPDRFLDGQAHEVTVEMYKRDDPDKRVIARISRMEKLPFHFNLPRPWITTSAAHAVAWTAEDEMKFLDIRETILERNYENGLTRARHFIDAKPSAIFKDFGIKDRYQIESLKFPAFRGRLTDRWGALFGAELCDKGAQCCKTFNLPYNTPQLGKAVVQDREMPDTWEKGGLLDSCPRKIRHFASKELTQKYANQYGIRTPAFFGAIRNIEEFDAFDFPLNYVLKPDFASGIELYLMRGDLNMFDGFKYSKEVIRNNVARFLETRPNAYFIVEEFLCQDIADEALPIIPLDYKIHCFGGRARFVQIVDKNAISRDLMHSRQCWLSRDWTHSPIPLRDAIEHPNSPVAKPEEFDKMCALADQISTDLDDYIRVDMYATPDGPVLGELSSFTNAGAGFTQYGDTILAQSWEIFHPR